LTTQAAVALSRIELNTTCYASRCGKTRENIGLGIAATRTQIITEGLTEALFASNVFLQVVIAILCLAITLDFARFVTHASRDVVKCDLT
jgi:hypothetical protein